MPESPEGPQTPQFDPNLPPTAEPTPAWAPGPPSASPETVAESEPSLSQPPAGWNPSPPPVAPGAPDPSWPTGVTRPPDPSWPTEVTQPTGTPEWTQPVGWVHNPAPWAGAATPPPPPPPGVAGSPGYPSWGPVPPYGYPPVPAPPRRRERVGVALAMVAVVLAAAVGVIIGRGLSPRTTVGTSSAGTAVPPSSGSASPGFGSGSGQASSGGTDATGSAAAAKVTPGVVDITTRLGYQNAAAAGTGMVITSNGEVLTNNHVVDGATTISVQVTSTGQSYKAKVVGTDPTDDVAVIQMEGASGLKTIPVGDSAKVASGQAVVAIGNAGGVGGAPSVVTGTVQAVNQSITASDQNGANAEQLSGLIETNAPLQPGDSGGPLATTGGQVIGMDTAASSGTRFESSSNVGFAIPIATALSIARQIESGKASANIQIGSPGFFGVEVQDASQAQQGGFGGFGQSGGATAPTTNGAEVAGVVSGSPAASAGLVAGDVITAIDGKTVGSATALTSIMHVHKPGDSVAVTWVDTSGQSHTASATLTTGPAD